MSLRVINGQDLDQPQEPPAATAPCPGDLAAITCFFNPCRYRMPVRNFRVFAEKCGLELFVIELSFDGKWEIPVKFNPLRVRTDHILWHKETLLNLLEASLPGRITKIAWLDADVLWDRADWPKLADQALQKFHVVQLFTDAIRLNADGSEDNRQRSAGWAHATNQPDKWNLGKWHPGFAWAARRELWRHGGLFDLHLTGGGDSLMVESFMRNHRATIAHAYGPAIYAAWKRWDAVARPWCAGRLGCIEATITHLWHGGRENRRYWERLQYLKTLDLDRDVARGANGLLRWTRPRSECEVRALVEDLFPKRREDG